MRFLIDVDGVVADMVPHILDHLKQELPEADLPELNEIQNDIFAPEKTALPPEALNYVLSWLTAPGFGQELPVVEGAIESINKIRQAGHDIYWVTAPWWNAKTWEHDRRAWIKKHFGDDHNKVIFAHAKCVCHGDVFIDDRVKNIREWQAENPKGKAFLYSQPWNSAKKYDKYQRFTWADVDKLLEE